MPDRPRRQMPVCRTPQIPRLMHHSRHMLTRIVGLIALLAVADLRIDARHTGAKLRLVIERGHHHVPPLPPLRVIAVMAADETPYVVVFRSARPGVWAGTGWALKAFTVWSDCVRPGQRLGRRASWPVGRVLCTRSRGPTAIHLGLPLPAASCGLPASIGRAALNRSRRLVPLARHCPSDLAPGGVYRAAAVTCGAGGLLHHRFTLTAGPEPGGGLFSVALSRGSPRVGVTDHPALRSPDLPQRNRRTGSTAAARPARPPLPTSLGRIRPLYRGADKPSRRLLGRQAV